MTAVATEPEVMLGSTMPRIWTRPLIVGEPGPCGCGCALAPATATARATSYGFRVEKFARDVLGTPLDPWERWLVIHAGELLPDGRPRFRTVLAIVARQNGKSLLMRVLILYWMFVEHVPMTLATSTDRSYAKAAWTSTCDAAKDNEYLAAKLDPKRCQTLQIGEEEFRNLEGAKYRFAAVNRRAGRSLTIHRLVLDELREHANYEAWGAATNAMNAVFGAQTFCVTNQGDDASVVLDWLRAAALTFLETGAGDRRLGLFEWSAPPGSLPTDVRALCAANPNAGRRLDLEALVGAAMTAQAATDPKALITFKTEVLCMRVDQLDPAIDPEEWKACADPAPLDLAEHRGRVALCLDVSLDQSHATLVAAVALVNRSGDGDEGAGRVHVEVVAAWDGKGCTSAVRKDLPGLVEKVKPRAIGWFPSGPAAGLVAALGERKERGVRWPPRRVAAAELRGEVTAVCMGLAEQVTTREIAHPDDEILNAHIGAAQKMTRGDAWVFQRKDSDPIDGAYALAGAVHLARTLPPAPAPLAAI